MNANNCQTHTQMLMWEAKRPSCIPGKASSTSDVVEPGRGVSPRGASDPPLRWSGNANFNVAKNTAAGSIGSVAQLCQEASKAALVARFQ